MTEAEYITMLITEVGDDTSGTLATNVPLYWARRASVADMELRFLLVKRDAIDLMLGKLRDAVDRTSGSDTVRESQAFDHLVTMKNDVIALITAQQTGGALAFVPVTYGVTVVDEFSR